MSGGRAPGKNVAWNKPQEPAFLKAFKAKVGYREPVTIDSKREAIKPPSDDEREDREDELPTVVVLKSGDISQEEFIEHRKVAKEQGKPNDNCAGEVKDSEGGRIMFKKPTKRRSSEGSVLDASTSKKAKPSDSHSSSIKSSSQSKTKRKGVKNKSLLSFGEDDEDHS